MVAEQPIGYIETTTKPHIGYTARLWKIVYENDVEVSRKVFNNSKYSPSKEVISIGIGGSSPEAQAAIAAAIESKDDAAILAAVANWTPEAVAARENAAAQAQQAQQAAATQQPSNTTGGTSNTTQPSTDPTTPQTTP